MQKDIHPEYKEKKFQLGEECYFYAGSTLKNDDSYKMEFYYMKKFPWAKEAKNAASETNVSVQRYRKKFGTESFYKNYSNLS